MKKRSKNLDKCLRIADKISMICYQKEILHKVYDDYVEQYDIIYNKLSEEDKKVCINYIYFPHYMNKRFDD